MPDPRLNCAAEICCPPVTALSDGIEKPEPTWHPGAIQAAVSILTDCGVPEDLAPKVAKSMRDCGFVILSAELATAIRNIAFP